MQLQDVSFSPSCMQIRTAYKIQKYWGQNLALLSCMQETFVLFLEFGHATSYFIKQITNEMNTMNTLLPNAKESQFWLKMQPVPSDKKKSKAGATMKVDSRVRKRRKHLEATFQAQTSHQAITSSFPRHD